MRARFALALLFAASSLSLACSSSSSDSGGTTDTGSGGTDTGAGDVQQDSGGGTDTNKDTGPKLCWIGNPTDTSAKTCDVCSYDKCKDKWTAAYGANYLSDDFTGGACKDNATCNCGCDEFDKVCQENCDISTESTGCRDAKAAIETCEKTNCTEICGFDTIDSGAEGG
jgi:hypothetical protein